MGRTGSVLTFLSVSADTSYKFFTSGTFGCDIEVPASCVSNTDNAVRACTKAIASYTEILALCHLLYPLETL